MVVTTQAQHTLDMEPAADLANHSGATVELACNKNKGKSKGKDYGKKYKQKKVYWLDLLRFKFTEGIVNKFVYQVLNHYVSDPQILDAVKRVVKSKAFRLIAIRLGLGQTLMKSCLQILLESWAPGSGTSPNGFDPEITLLPYAWSPGQGFYGDLLTANGWQNGSGYTCNSSTDDANVFQQSTSYPGNIYHNDSNITEFSWNHIFYNQHNMNINLFVRYSNSRIYISSTSPSYPVIEEADGNLIYFEDIWVSTVDSSARCRIWSTNGKLDMDYELNAEGVGGGSLTLAGNLYQIWVEANGHGYWTKNDGKKHRF